MKADARARLTAGLEMVRGGKWMDPGRSGLLPALTAAMILAALALAGRPSIAATDPRLGARLDPETAAAVEAVIDAARDKGLPVEPLVDRALEGGSRQAPGPRIVASVRSLAADLETAREAMGAGSSPAELVAGAAAVAAGVRPDTLARLRAARPRESVVVPLVVLTDLVIRRVPIETAGAAVLAATRAHVRDRELMRLRQRIDLDIGAGAPPAKAAIVRTRNLIGTFEGPASRLPPADRPGSGP